MPSADHSLLSVGACCALKAMQVVIAICIDILSLQITAEDGYAPLCTFLETILTMLW